MLSFLDQLSLVFNEPTCLLTEASKAPTSASKGSGQDYLSRQSAVAIDYRNTKNLLRQIRGLEKQAREVGLSDEFHAILKKSMLPDHYEMLFVDDPQRQQTINAIQKEIQEVQNSPRDAAGKVVPGSASDTPQPGSLIERINFHQNQLRVLASQPIAQPSKVQLHSQELDKLQGQLAKEQADLERKLRVAEMDQALTYGEVNNLIKQVFDPQNGFKARLFSRQRQFDDRWEKGQLPRVFTDEVIHRWEPTGNGHWRKVEVHFRANEPLLDRVKRFIETIKTIKQTSPSAGEKAHMDQVARQFEAAHKYFLQEFSSMGMAADMAKYMAYTYALHYAIDEIQTEDPNAVEYVTRGEAAKFLGMDVTKLNGLDPHVLARHTLHTPTGSVSVVSKPSLIRYKIRSTAERLFGHEAVSSGLVAEDIAARQLSSSPYAKLWDLAKGAMVPLKKGEKAPSGKIGTIKGKNGVTKIRTADLTEFLLKSTNALDIKGQTSSQAKARKTTSPAKSTAPKPAAPAKAASGTPQPAPTAPKPAVTPTGPKPATGSGAPMGKVGSPPTPPQVSNSPTPNLPSTVDLETKDFLSPQESATMLGVSLQDITNMELAGRLERVYDQGGKRCFDGDQVRAIRDAKRNPPGDE
jgi:hypothetical protein